VFEFGVTDHGSAAETGRALNVETVAITAHPGDGYWLLHGSTLVSDPDISASGPQKA
jgi:hypothetical protein